MADQFGISRGRVQQVAKEYRDTGETPTIQTPDRKPYATYPAHLVARILYLFDQHEQGSEAITHILCSRDDILIDTNHVHAILKEHQHVTDNPIKRGRQRSWVRWERDLSLATLADALNQADFLENFHDDREWIGCIDGHSGHW